MRNAARVIFPMSGEEMTTVKYEVRNEYFFTALSRALPNLGQNEKIIAHNH